MKNKQACISYTYLHTVEGRRRLVERCQGRPIAHVAAEMGISSDFMNNARLFTGEDRVGVRAAGRVADEIPNSRANISNEFQAQYTSRVVTGFAMGRRW